MLLHTTRFVRISENENIKDADVIILGVPFDSTEIFLPGQRLAPDEIRTALLTLDIGNLAERIYDAGNVNVAHGNVEETVQRVEDVLSDIRARNQNAGFMILGGEHTISYAAVKFFSEKYDRLQVLFMDAHADCYDEYNGIKLMHATVLRRISEIENVILTTVGIRAESENISDIEIMGLEELDTSAPTYVSIDMDVLDPSLMKSVSDPVPSGLKLDDVLNVVKGFGDVVAVDIVELNPLINDYSSIKLAAWLCRSILELMLNEG